MTKGTSARVLVVEDDPEFRAALEDMLAGSGHEVVVATNGADAIALLEAGERPSAVLVDLLMPGVVGQELLEYLRSSADLARIPVAIVSASPQLAPEGYTVFPKPLQPGPLLEFVRDLSAPPAA
jgi:CheY-like chemotaxis protein